MMEHEDQLIAEILGGGLARHIPVSERKFDVTVAAQDVVDGLTSELGLGEILQLLEGSYEHVRPEEAAVVREWRERWRKTGRG